MAVTSAASTLTALADAYKERFPDDVLQQTAFMERDLLKWLPKKDDLTGDGIWVPIRYQPPQGLGSGFAQMQANITAGKVKKAFITRKRYYGGVALDDEAIRAARDRTGSFYDMKEGEIEDMIMNVAQELEKHLWRSGTGALGTISSITSAVPSVITLTNPEDVANFAVGMNLESRSSGGSDRGGDEPITAINIVAGTITMTSNLVADHSWAATDVLVRGQASAGASSDYNNVVNGLSAWIPAAYETSGTFLQMDRTDVPHLLQGFNQAFLGTIEETVKKIRSLQSRFGGNPDSVWLSHNNWHRLEVELAGRAIRHDGSAETFGIPSLKYAAPKGTLSVMAGAFCPEDVGYLLKRASWMLHHLDPLPHIVMTDGNRSLRGADFDGVELRARYWCELSCRSPKDNARFVIS